MPSHLRALIVALALAGSATGCAAELRYYDGPNGDYHRWNHGEERAYRAYLHERREEYRDFGRLNQRDQERYWEWRHGHADRDRDRDRDHDRR